jgi:hypothetical protein
MRVLPLASRCAFEMYGLKNSNSDWSAYCQGMVFVAWIHFDDPRERGRMVATVRAVVEDQEIAVVQRPRVVLLGERRTAELPYDLPGGAGA